MEQLFDSYEHRTVLVSGIGGRLQCYRKCTNISWDERTGILRFADSNGTITKAGGNIGWIAEGEDDE